MGGNAFGYETARLRASDYYELEARSIAVLRETFPETRVEPIRAYRNKPDFGDCDILVERGAGYSYEQAAKALGAIEVVPNGPVCSVGVPIPPQGGNSIFQIDLVTATPLTFDFSRGYFGQGDIGNLIGRLYHACGLAFRHDGLYYYVRDGDYKFREIALTLNFNFALELMQYNVQTFENGFDSPEDIFSYVASSPFFNPDIFLLHNRNAQSRVRDRKRPMYTAFLKFCEENPNLPKFQFPENKSDWLPRLFEYFAGFKQEYDRALADLAKLRQVKAKFNGAWVSQVTGLQGKELGVVMQAFRHSFTTQEDLNDYVLATPLEELERGVKALI
jgi:hypothetical protein